MFFYLCIPVLSSTHEGRDIATISGSLIKDQSSFQIYVEEYGQVSPFKTHSQQVTFLPESPSTSFNTSLSTSLSPAFNTTLSTFITSPSESTTKSILDSESNTATTQINLQRSVSDVKDLMYIVEGFKTSLSLINLDMTGSDVSLDKNKVNDQKKAVYKYSINSVVMTFSIGLFIIVSILMIATSLFGIVFNVDIRSTYFFLLNFLLGSICGLLICVGCRKLENYIKN